MNERLRDIVQAALKLQEDRRSAEESDWSVYRLTNPKTKEIYHGVAKGEVKGRFSDHMNGEVVATSKWVWGKDGDGITYKVLHSGLTKTQASDKAHALEKTIPPKGFAHLQTGGT